MPKRAGDRRPPDERVVRLIQETNDEVRNARLAIRDARKKVFRTGRQAAAATGLGASTVARLENVKGDEKYDPPLGTVLRLLTRLAVPPAAFFEQLGRSQNPSLKSSTPPTDNPPQAVLPTEGADHVDVDEAVIKRASDKLAAALIAYVRRLAQGDEPAATPRRPATRRRPRVRQRRNKGA